MPGPRLNLPSRPSHRFSLSLSLALLLGLFLLCVSPGALAASLNDLPPAVYEQVAMLTSTDGISYDHFGSSVAISTDGNTIVVGLNNGEHNAAYVFVKPAGGWANATETAELTPSDGGYAFGSSVAIAGNTIFVASQISTQVNETQYTRGAVYIYEAPTSGWVSSTETVKLTVGPNYAVAITIAAAGNSLAATFTSQNNPPTAGGIFVWNKPAAGWGKQAAAATLITSDQNFIFDSLAFSTTGNTLVAGGNNGVVYLWSKPAAGWNEKNSIQTAELITSDGNTGDNLGSSVAATDTTVVSGAPGRNAGDGAAYVYVKPSGGWVNAEETAQLSAADGPDLGFGVAISGNSIFAGSAYANVGGTFQAGAVFLYNKPSAGWKTTSTFASELVATSPLEQAYMGTALAVGGGTIIAGAPGATLGSNIDQGTAYVFEQ